jgi:hypothetical protein
MLLNPFVYLIQAPSLILKWALWSMRQYPNFLGNNNFPRFFVIYLFKCFSYKLTAAFQLCCHKILYVLDDSLPAEILLPDAAKPAGEVLGVRAALAGELRCYLCGGCSLCHQRGFEVILVNACYACLVSLRRGPPCLLG